MYIKKWIKSFLIASLLIIFSVSAINYIINPYNVFGHGWDKSFSKKSNLLSDRMSKFYTVNRYYPQTIMMGTSRIGIFPSTQLHPYLDGPIYNLSLAGSTIDEQAVYIRYMIDHHHIKNVIWSLDFFSFNPTKPIDPSFEPKRLSDSYYLNDYYISLFSFKTLFHSIKTIIANSLSANPLNQIEGQPFTVNQVRFNIKSTLHEYSREKTFLNSNRFKEPSSIDDKIKILNQIVQYCHEKNVSCILYTSPVFYQHIDMIYSIGLGNTFEYWKKALTYIQPYTDFCTHSNLSHETMKFRDSSHVISDVGELIFVRIFNPNKHILSSDFGYTVTPENIDQHIQEDRKQVHEFTL